MRRLRRSHHGEHAIEHMLGCVPAIRKRERLTKNQAAYRQRKKEAANNAD